MNPISDDELDAYALGLIDNAKRRTDIATALLSSAQLRGQYDARLELLRRAEVALEPQEPDAEFEARLWPQIALRLEAIPTAQVRETNRRGLNFPLVAAAAVALMALGTVWWMQPRGSPQKPLTPPMATQAVKPPRLLAHNAAERILLDRLSEHFAETQVLLTAVAQKSTFENQQALTEQMLALNRLYALAARRAGHLELAHTLETLEPALQTLSTQSESGVPETALDPSELAFRVQAAEGLTQRLSAQPHSVSADETP